MYYNPWYLPSDVFGSEPKGHSNLDNRKPILGAHANHFIH